MLAGKFPDPVRVVSAIREQHCLWEQCAEENRAQPIVVRLTWCEGEMNRQAIGVHHSVNLACQPSSRTTYILVAIVRDAGSVLVYTHDGGIDHLHRRVVTGGQRIHDPVPDARPPPTNEAIVAGCAGTVGLRQIAKERLAHPLMSQ
ncbi:hypothetical protein XI09_05780 [Bradyrhizobium sp. CCBAU 11386]|nr:hypothetical protein [Bradyrhizobium sp. CCBAU 11386]